MTYAGHWADGQIITADKLNSSVLNYGTKAARPTAAAKGVHYYSTDKKVHYYDDSAAWNLARDGVFLVKSADETIATDDTLTADNTLVFAVNAVADEIWMVEILAIVNSGATPDFKFSITAPGASTIDGVAHGPAVGAGFGFQTLTEGSTATSGESSGTDYPLLLTFVVIDAGTVGNVSFTWAQNTSDAGNTIVRKGSFLRARVLNPGS